LAGSAAPGGSVEVLVGGATYSVVVDESGRWSVDTATATPISGSFVPLTEGSNEIAVTSIDSDGNRSTDPTIGDVEVDTSIVTPSIETVAVNQSAPTLSAERVKLGLR